MQVHTFYEPAIVNLYRSQPELKEKSFSEQTKAIIENGFSAIHMFAPYLEKLGYQAQLIIANCQSAQYKWGQDNNIKLMNTLLPWRHDITRQQIEAFKPEILYLSDPITFDSYFVNSLSYRPKLVMGWCSSSIPQFTDWSNFDVLLSFHKMMRDRAVQMGVKGTEHFYPGFPEWILQQTRDVQPIYDIVFSGSWTGVHGRRNHLLTHIAKEFGNKNDHSVAFFIGISGSPLPEEVKAVNHGGRYGLDMFKSLRQGKIVINAGGDVRVPGSEADFSQGDSINMRLFEITGCGSFLLTEYHENLKQYFELGVEIETFSCEEELTDKIRYYLAYPEKREKIAKRGHERCLREHSMVQRAHEFDRVICKYID